MLNTIFKTNDIFPFSHYKSTNLEINPWLNASFISYIWQDNKLQINAVQNRTFVPFFFQDNADQRRKQRQQKSYSESTIFLVAVTPRSIRKQKKYQSELEIGIVTNQSKTFSEPLENFKLYADSQSSFRESWKSIPFDISWVTIETGMPAYESPPT